MVFSAVWNSWCGEDILDMSMFKLLLDCGFWFPSICVMFPQWWLLLNLPFEPWSLELVLWIAVSKCSSLFGSCVLTNFAVCLNNQNYIQMLDVWQPTWFYWISILYTSVFVFFFVCVFFRKKNWQTYWLS